MNHIQEKHLLPTSVKWLWKLTESHMIMPGKPTVGLGDNKKRGKENLQHGSLKCAKARRKGRGKAGPKGNKANRLIGD